MEPIRCAEPAGTSAQRKRVILLKVWQGTGQSLAARTAAATEHLTAIDHGGLLSFTS